MLMCLCCCLLAESFVMCVGLGAVHMGVRICGCGLHLALYSVGLVLSFWLFGVCASGLGPSRFLTLSGSVAVVAPPLVPRVGPCWCCVVCSLCLDASGKWLSGEAFCLWLSRRLDWLFALLGFDPCLFPLVRGVGPPMLPWLACMACR